MSSKPAAWTATPDEIRARFLKFFEERGHTVLPSASLVPENDPSLLFIGAGMAPFKDHFLGRVPLTFRRAATSQKCLRTGDLENVGRTPGHHTFFEMLGNFSFGDSSTGGYGKEDAIRWAWEFLTVEMGIPAKRLSVTVYRDDDDAARFWDQHARIPGDPAWRVQIRRLGAKSNYWPANAPEDGPDGPCGPCSEIFFDLGFKPVPGTPCTETDCGGEDVARSPHPDCDCRRALEVWNLVFQQFNRQGRNNLVPLAMRNIDTGMGFERLLTVLAHLNEGKPFGERGIYSNFDTPLFGDIVAIGNRREGVDRIDRPEIGNAVGTRARRVADHARAAAFCVEAGVRPSNEGRGYVLRRVIRRAVRDLITLGFAEPHLHAYVSAISKSMAGAYPDLRTHVKEISSVIQEEEKRFRETYAQGIQLLNREVAALSQDGERVLPGTVLFELYDTFGFPVDLAADQLHELGIDPDMAGFEVEMEKARRRSREGSRMAVDIFAAGPLERVKKESAGTVFLGYGPSPEKPDGTYDWDPGVEGNSTVVEILVAEKPVDRLEPGQEGAVLLKETPFYAEQGGQVGDAGEIRGPGGARFVVADTKKVEGFHLHLGRLEGGALARGAAVTAVVDRARRDAIRRNHTGTHLLHRVLRNVLGEDARQAGSLVAPGYLRFDFSWPKGLAPGERERIEAEVNRRIRANDPVLTRVYGIDEARATGAVSMFGEKYGSRVRVLSAGDSKEFCGGTHCRATGDIQEFRIVAEKSIGSGVRRIEAVTGTEAVTALEAERKRAVAQEEEQKRRREEDKAERKAEAQRHSAAALDPLAAPRRASGPIAFVVMVEEGVPDGALMASGDRVKADAGAPLAALVLSKGEAEVAVVAAGNPAAVKAGFKAGAAVGVVAKALGGGGGGRPDFARGKGRDASRLPDAIAAFEAYLATLAR